MSNWAARKLDRPLCRVADLPEGQSVGFDPLDEGRDTMFVVRKGDTVHAWRNLCPHYDRARMAWKKDEFLNGDRSRIMCAAHGALFRIEDGVCEIGPCVGQSLTPVPVRLHDGALWIVGEYAPGFRR
ncbi:MAG: Rieske 2Fe-2S domain-containing protein [Pseudomonadota bacterium]|nr:Rieske 2Fe-2S domain-containing protein [Pseudomonadota bacterium]